jgi:glycoprotein endo-alpha-1,2-mannosidase
MLGRVDQTRAVESRAALTALRLPALLAVAIASACVALPAAGAGRADGTERAAIFYYPWYSTPTRDGRWAHWYVEHDGSPVLSTPYFPTRGLYSSSNVEVVSAQMREIAAAGVGTVVVSWWGFDSPEHDRLLLVEQAAVQHGLDVAIHLEPYRGRTPARAADDIAALRHEWGFTDFYLYDADREPAAAWAEALEPLEGTGVRILGHTIFVGRAKASGFDGLYTYDVVTWNGALFRRLCTQAHAAGLLCAPSVGPGYDARLATRHEVVRPRNDGLTYDRMWKTAIRAGADLVTITSYNEWQEGTQIEPARIATGMPSYDGAWGKKGVAAQRAYLAATAHWAARLNAERG